MGIPTCGLPFKSVACEFQRVNCFVLFWVSNPASRCHSNDKSEHGGKQKPLDHKVAIGSGSILDPLKGRGVISSSFFLQGPFLVHFYFPLLVGQGYA